MYTSKDVSLGYFLKLKEFREQNILGNTALFNNGATAPLSQGLLIIDDSQSHLFRRTTLGRTSLDE